MRTNLGNLPITIDPVTGQAKMVRGSAGAGIARLPGKRGVNEELPARAALAPTFDSQLEADRANYLFGLQLGEMIVRYVHHPFSVEIGPGRWYTPDFLVEWIDGAVTIEEIKGSLKQKNARDGETRFLAAAGKLPMFEWQLITRVERQWIVRRSL